MSQGPRGIVSQRSCHCVLQTFLLSTRPVLTQELISRLGKELRDKVIVYSSLFLTRSIH